MSHPSRIWLPIVILYGLFFYWYTDFGGPVTEQEISQLAESMRANGNDEAYIDYITTFFREDTGRQFLMVNNIDTNDSPPSMPGMPADADAEALMAVYMEHMIPELFKRACHPVIVGASVYNAIDVMGINDAESWSDAALFRYRSRRALLEIIGSPAFRGPHDYKLAALDKTVAYPIETSLYIGDLRILLGLFSLIIGLSLQLWLGGMAPEGK